MTRIAHYPHRLTLAALAALSAGCLAALAAAPASASAPAATASPATLYGVSCTAASHCMAVGAIFGSAQEFTIAEAWNGSTWKVLPTPSPPRPGGELDAISCTSGTRCMAVGSAILTRGSRPLAESWNGTAWTVVPTPPAGARNAGLSGVSCPGPSDCMAVGSRGTPKNPAQATLAESWNGTAWKIVPTPVPPAPGGTALNGVSCTTASSCMAVGYFGFQAVSGNSRTLAESWNGSTWQRLLTPDPGRSGSLAGVACTAASSCMAAGIRAEHLPLRLSGTLSEQWNGTAWVARPSPDAGGSNFDEFDGVACTGPAACMATGDGTRQTGETTFTVAASWNGTSWSLLRSPSPGGNVDELLGVSCTGSSSCMAVGDAEGLGNDHTLAEAWNGTIWKVIPTPRP